MSVLSSMGADMHPIADLPLSSVVRSFRSARARRLSRDRHYQLSLGSGRSVRSRRLHGIIVRAFGLASPWRASGSLKQGDGRPAGTGGAGRSVVASCGWARARLTATHDASGEGAGDDRLAAIPSGGGS
jgi:hypothetical protein